MRQGLKCNSRFVFFKNMKQISSKVPVGILGATGMVGQRLVSLLRNHPWFEVVSVSASRKSAGKSYGEAVAGRWAQKEGVPEEIKKFQVHSVEDELENISKNVKIIFSALEADKDFIKKTEEKLAFLGSAVVSVSSAHRWTADVPIIMPEINPDHLDIIKVQRKNRGWKNGFIIVKPNCSVQCYVPLLRAWKDFHPKKVIVSTYQAVSGAGKTLGGWPEMEDNIIPYIKDEEEKSEKEPMKILGKLNLEKGKVELVSDPIISSNCVRVPVSDGHLTAVNISFKKRVTKDDLINALLNFKNPLDKFNLPSAPKPFIRYFKNEDRPQTKLDRDFQNGMSISVGRLKNDPVLGWRCFALSHNTLRGAAGGAVLAAELAVKKGFIS